MELSRCNHDSMNIQKMSLLLILTIYYKYLIYENIFNLGIKTVLLLKYNRINGLVESKMEMRNSQLEQRQQNKANTRLVLHV